MCLCPAGAGAGDVPQLSIVTSSRAPADRQGLLVAPATGTAAAGDAAAPVEAQGAPGGNTHEESPTHEDDEFYDADESEVLQSSMVVVVLT
jgi:hypothetical protein